MRTAQPVTRQGFTVTNGSRGEDIKRRRFALGIDSIHKLHKATGIDRETLSRAEAGNASDATYDRLEAWLDRVEEEDGGAPDSAGPIKLTFHDVYGIGEIIVEGPVDHPDELTEAVGKILERIRSQSGRGPNGAPDPGHK